MKVCASNKEFRELNIIINSDENDIEIDECYGHRFIASGLQTKKTITINGVPGNALGSYLDGAKIVVNGNVQDAVGDTMNSGEIIVHGNAGDALGYAMRGGIIYIKGDCGYRTGIHMKQYEDKKPVIVVGGKTGSFVGEYLAGGLIIILGLDTQAFPVGNFPGTGMHGGKMFIRSKFKPTHFPAQVSVDVATKEDLEEINEYVKGYCDKFSVSENEIINETFYVVTPNSNSPYKQIYTYN